jgi:hypothetical protein
VKSVKDLDVEDTKDLDVRDAKNSDVVDGIPFNPAGDGVQCFGFPTPQYWTSRCLEKYCDCKNQYSIDDQLMPVDPTPACRSHDIARNKLPETTGGGGSREERPSNPTRHWVEEIGHNATDLLRINKSEYKEGDSLTIVLKVLAPTPENPIPPAIQGGY